MKRYQLFTGLSIERLLSLWYVELLLLLLRFCLQQSLPLRGSCGVFTSASH